MGNSKSLPPFHELYICCSIFNYYQLNVHLRDKDINAILVEYIFFLKNICGT